MRFWATVVDVHSFIVHSAAGPTKEQSAVTLEVLNKDDTIRLEGPIRLTMPKGIADMRFYLGKYVNIVWEE